MPDDLIVSVAKEISAPAEVVFALLADPAKHPEIDGSGMLRSATSSGVISGVGDIFTMQMHNEEMGDYEMINHVVTYEAGRCIAWEPVLLHAGRAEDKEDEGVRSGHRWSFNLAPINAGTTVATESYDCSSAPAWLQKAVKGGTRWQVSMEISLENISRLCSTDKA
ncbi:MAG TPA: SRPBCC family protein [Acidimicrobiales bacterium]|nr:SRPBCC family protein [Acidimicrobiales bacterium]